MANGDYRTGVRRLSAAEAVLLAVIVVTAAALRLVNVGENPMWFADEGTHIDIASHLSAGRVQYLAIRDSTLLFAKPPLFHAVLALLMKIAPDADEMLLLRRLTGALGTACVLLLYIGVRGVGRARLAALAALALAVFPQAVLYSRFGFSYNLLAALLLGAFVCLAKYVTSRSNGWLAASSLLVGLGTLTDIAGFAFVPPFAIGLTWVAGLRSLPWNLSLVVTPFGLYAGWLLLYSPGAFWFDVVFISTRLSGASGPAAQLLTLGRNCRELIAQSAWIAFGVFGLLLVRPRSLAAIAAAAIVLPLVNIGRVAPLTGLSAYYVIPLLPFLALGAAAIPDRIYRWTVDAVTNRTTRPRYAGAIGIIAALAVALPLIRSTAALPRFVSTRFVTPIDRFLIDPSDARRVAAFLNAHAAPYEVVMASPAMAWLLTSRVTEFQLTAAADGARTAHLPGNIPSSRFAFPVTFEATKFVIVDGLWQRWGVHYVPGLATMLRVIEGWPLVFQSGDLRVYRKPDERRTKN